MEDKNKKAASAPTQKKPREKKKQKKHVSQGRCHIKNAFGNTIITITDMKGNVLCWSTAGKLGFKGSRKGTPFAAQATAEDVTRKASAFGLESVDVLQKGPGPGRETSIRALVNSGLKIRSLRDVTPLPHNGCRPPKRRRV